VKNIVVNLCAKFNEDLLRNGEVLGNGKCDNDNPKNKNNVRSFGTRSRVQETVGRSPPGEHRRCEARGATLTFEAYTGASIPNNHGAILPFSRLAPPPFLAPPPSSHSDNFWTLYTQFCEILCVFSVNFRSCQSGIMTPKKQKKI